MAAVQGLELAADMPRNLEFTRLTVAVPRGPATVKVYVHVPKACSPNPSAAPNGLASRLYRRDKAPLFTTL